MRQYVIDQLRAEELMGGPAPEIGERAGYKCEYCDKDLLASVDDYAFSWQCDHIIPRAAGGEETFENLALSCVACNMGIKRDWNPQDEAGENASREELIQAVRQRVREEWHSWEPNLLRVREIVTYVR